MKYNYNLLYRKKKTNKKFEISFRAEESQVFVF